MRVPFDQIFTVTPEGQVRPKCVVQVGPARLTPAVAAGSGASFGGVKLTDLIGRELEIEEKDGIVILKGAY